MTNKASEILEEILNDDEYADSDCTTSGFYKDYIEKAIAELKAHKAKLENLKEWCKEHTVNTAATKYDPFWKGYQECSMFILKKLEELDK